MQRVPTGTDEARKLAAKATLVLEAVRKHMPDVDLIDALCYLTWLVARAQNVPIDRVLLALVEYERANSKVGRN